MATHILIPTEPSAFTLKRKINMNDYPNQERDLHSRRSRIELPYPGSPSPPQSKMSARQPREPGLRRTESIASHHSHQSQEGKHHAQRPRSPPTDPLTPPMSRRGSLNHNNHVDSSHVPKQHYQYDPNDYPNQDDSFINFTPPSSADTTFNDHKPPSETARPARRGTNPYTERILNPVTGYLNKVTCDSSDSEYERVEYYDPQGRLTDSNGTVIVNEPVKVPHDSQNKYYEHDDGMNRRHRQQVTTTDAPSESDYPESLFLKERFARATQNDGDQTPRQRSPVSPRTKSPTDRETKQSRVDTLRKNYGLSSRPGAQEDRDTRYGPSMSTATIKYAKKDRVSNLKAVHDGARSYKRDLSPAQSVSSLSSHYSAHSHRAKDPPRAPRTHKQESSESRRSHSPVNRDRGQKHQSTTTRDRSLSPVERYQSHQNVSERSRRSISPPRTDHGRRDVQIRSKHFSSSGSESDYSTPRRSKSGDSLAIMMMFTSKSKKRTSRDSKDSWDRKTFSGPSPVEQTFAPATLARRQEAMTQATQRKKVIGLLRSWAESLEEVGSNAGTKMTVVSLGD